MYFYKVTLDFVCFYMEQIKYISQTFFKWEYLSQTFFIGMNLFPCTAWALFVLRGLLFKCELDFTAP